MDILINSVPLSDYGGSSLLDYSIGATEIDNSVYQGINRTNWNLLKSTFGMRDISITMIFAGHDLHEAKLNRSRVSALLWADSEIYIPDDGFYYSCVGKDLGAEELVGIGSDIAKVKATYQLRGIRHGEKITATIPANGTVYCISTMPYTDCKLTCVTSAAATSFQLGGATFTDVSASQSLVFDGITGAVKKGGVNAAATTSWVRFPALVPGANVITCSRPVTVEYTPVFI